jgi:hypothetical protein
MVGCDDDAVIKYAEHPDLAYVGHCSANPGDFGTIWTGHSAAGPGNSANRTDARSRGQFRRVGRARERTIALPTAMAS